MTFFLQCDQLVNRCQVVVTPHQIICLLKIYIDQQQLHLLQEGVVFPKGKMDRALRQVVFGRHSQQVEIYHLISFRVLERSECRIRSFDVHVLL